MSVGTTPPDEYGQMVKGIGGVVIDSLDSGGFLTGTEHLDGVMEPHPPGTCPPCTFVTSTDKGPGSVNVYMKVNAGGDMVNLNWSTGDVFFGHTSPTGGPGCYVPVAGANLPATTTVDFSELEKPGPHTYSVSRVDDFVAFGMAIKGSMTLSMTILRVNADGTPYTGTAPTP